MKFLENMSFGQYIPASSCVHRLDPRAKIGALVLILTGIFMASQPYDWILWCALLLLCSFLSEIKVLFLLRSFFPHPAQRTNIRYMQFL